MDPGLVNSWGQGVWGLHFPVDQALSEALSADYDMVFIPGGKRGIDKLKLTAHTNRFIKGFFENEKPVFVCNTAVMLFEEFSPVAGRQITGPEEIKSRMERSGAIWQEQPVICDTNLVTSDFSSFANAEEAISSMWHAAFNSNNDMKEAA